MIESINNERVKYWAKLNEKKYQEKERLFLIEGRHLVEEAKKANLLKEVILLEGEEIEFSKQTIVSENVMKKITNLTNIPSIIGVAEFLEKRDIEGNVLLLDRVSNPGNLGTIIRSSVAFGIDTIILGNGSCSIYNPKVVRATEGLMFHVNIIEEDLTKSIESLKKQNYSIYSTSVTSGKILGSFHFPTKTAVVMGNEGAGVSDEIRNLCDEFLYIGMSDKCESLNVAIATSIILYELYK